MAKCQSAIRYASLEFKTTDDERIHLWDEKPERRVHEVKGKVEWICWLGSMSNLLESYTTSEFIEIFGDDTCPGVGCCSEIEISKKRRKK